MSTGKWLAKFLRSGVLRRVDRLIVNHILKDLVCYVVPIGKWLATLLRILVPSSAKSRGSRRMDRFLNCLTARNVGNYLPVARA